MYKTLLTLMLLILALGCAGSDVVNPSPDAVQIALTQMGPTSLSINLDMPSALRVLAGYDPASMVQVLDFPLTTNLMVSDLPPRSDVLVIATAPDGSHAEAHIKLE